MYASCREIRLIQLGKPYTLVEEEGYNEYEMCVKMRMINLEAMLVYKE